MSDYPTWGSFLMHANLSEKSLSLEGPEVAERNIDIESSERNSSVATRNSLEDVELETRALTEPLPTNQLV